MTAEVLPHLSIYGLDDDGPELRIECWCHACGKRVSVRVIDVSEGEPSVAEVYVMAHTDRAMWKRHLREKHGGDS